MYIITYCNIKNWAFPSAVCVCVCVCVCVYFCEIEQTAAVYVYSFNYLFFVMKMQCVFYGVPTELWSITINYGEQKHYHTTKPYIWYTLQWQI
jgi:hypothetical protein